MLYEVITPRRRAHRAHHRDIVLDAEAELDLHGAKAVPAVRRRLVGEALRLALPAQAVDWIPEMLFDIVKAAYHHKGFSFIRIVQRCPEWLPKVWDPWLHDPSRILLLTHEDGVAVSESLAKVYRNRREHDPADLNRAREIAADSDNIPVGVLYRNPEVPCYEDLRAGTRQP